MEKAKSWLSSRVQDNSKLCTDIVKAVQNFDPNLQVLRRTIEEQAQIIEKKPYGQKTNEPEGYCYTHAGAPSVYFTPVNSIKDRERKDADQKEADEVKKRYKEVRIKKALEKKEALRIRKAVIKKK